MGKPSDWGQKAGRLCGMNRDIWKAGCLVAGPAFPTNWLNSVGQSLNAPSLFFLICKIGPQTAMHPP